MIAVSVLLLALLFDAPVLWRACIDQTLPLGTAVVRFLLAVPVAWLLLAGVRAATRRDGRDSAVSPDPPRSR